MRSRPARPRLVFYDPNVAYCYRHMGRAYLQFLNDRYEQRPFTTTWQHQARGSDGRWYSDVELITRARKQARERGWL